MTNFKLHPQRRVSGNSCPGNKGHFFPTFLFITWWTFSTSEVVQVRGHGLGSFPFYLDRYMPCIFVARQVESSLRSSTSIELLFIHVVRLRGEDGMISRMFFTKKTH